MKDDTPPPTDPRDPDVQRWKYVTLRLKAPIRTDEAYLVDLGQGKVWIPLSAIRATRRVEQGIFEIEVREDMIKEKRAEMRQLKEKATGVKGSILGEVVAVKGTLLKEDAEYLWINCQGKELAIPRVCFSECAPAPDGSYDFVIQKDYFSYALRSLAAAASAAAEMTVVVDLVRETDRAYLFSVQGKEIWFPKRQVVSIKDLEGNRREIVVPSDFWRFKLEEGKEYQ
ncbi:MAG: hypothetical protein NTV79_11685 [Candidatus Aureabacteria bacterium]|nr:hypothetical protein [Candidatus Auribacterota bacterium]